MVVNELLILCIVQYLVSFGFRFLFLFFFLFYFLAQTKQNRALYKTFINIFTALIGRRVLHSSASRRHAAPRAAGGEMKKEENLFPSINHELIVFYRRHMEMRQINTIDVGEKICDDHIIGSSSLDALFFCLVVV